MHSRYIPTSASSTQNQICLVGRRLRKMLSSGTMTTYSAVMKPALEAVV